MKRPARELEVTGGGSGPRLDFLTMLLLVWTRPQLLALLELFLEAMRTIPYETTQLEQVALASGNALVQGAPSLSAAADFMFRESHAFPDDASLRSMLLCLLAFDMRVQRFAYSNHKHHQVLGSCPPDRQDLGTFRLSLQQYVKEFLYAVQPQAPIELVRRCRELLETYRRPVNSLPIM